MIKNREVDIDNLIKNFLNMGPVPVVLMKVLEVVGDRRQSLTRLITEISKDPIITTHILSAVNSSYYGLKSRVSNLTQSVSLLGFNRIAEIILSYSTKQMTENIAGKCEIYHEDLWIHSIKTAFLCRYLARDLAPGFQKISYSAGILHDIGKLAITATADEKAASDLSQILAEGVPTNSAEEMVMGFNHTYLGFKILCKLKLSSEILTPVFEHHNQAGEFSSRNSYLLTLANILACHNYPEDENRLEEVLKNQLNTSIEELGIVEKLYNELNIDMENSQFQLKYRS